MKEKQVTIFLFLQFLIIMLIIEMWNILEGLFKRQLERMSFSILWILE